MDVDALNNISSDYPSKDQGNERGGKNSGQITYLLYFSDTYSRQTNQVTHLVNVCAYLKIVNILDVYQKTHNKPYDLMILVDQYQGVPIYRYITVYCMFEGK